MKGTPVERFWRRVAKQPGDDGCWLFQGAHNGKGYVGLRVGRRGVYAHRFSYELHCGPIPTGMLVCHTCDVRNCVNPDHLFIGTQQDNVDDMIQKGRQEPAESKRATMLTRAVRGDAHWSRRQDNETREKLAKAGRRGAAVSPGLRVYSAEERSAIVRKGWETRRKNQQR